MSAKKHLISLLAVLLLASQAFAQPLGRILVAGPAELNAALKTAKPGDVITLKNGRWLDAKITINRGGAPEKPLELRAETPGEVVIGGSSSLIIAAPYVTVTGLLFKDGKLTAKENVIWFKSHHGIVQDTAIIDYNPARFETKYHWVDFAGSSNLVDRCLFQGKNHMGPLVQNDEFNCRHNALTSCWFKDIPLKANANGRESVKISGAGHVDASSPDGAYFTLEGNLFEHADGEGVEVISIKSNHNQIRHNTLIASAGCLNIRRGSYNVVQANVILGRGVARAQGIRMSGEHNLISGNFVSGCEYGIAVSSGEYWEKALTPSYVVNDRDGSTANKSRYPQNKFVTISRNLLANNSEPDLDIGVMEYKKHWPENQNVLLPEECRIENNLCVRPHGGDSVIGMAPDIQTPLDRFTFKPNSYKENLLYGGKNHYAAAAAGFVEQVIPADWTEAKALAGFQPLTPADVGPDWIRTKGR